MALARSQMIRRQLNRWLVEPQQITSLFGSSRRYTNLDSKVPVYCYRAFSTFPLYNNESGRQLWISGRGKTLCSSMVTESSSCFKEVRTVSTQVNAPPQARQMGGMQVAMLSPGIVYEPYAPREPISFWRRWFTRSGWRRTKEDMILELKSAYAINKLRKSGYSKKKFYEEAVQLYKEINTLMANGDKSSLRKTVTEQMYSALKNEIKYRESMWSSIYWELVMPVQRVRTLRARLIGVDKNDLSKVFVQLTLEFLTKQVLVRDIWVFEKSMFHQGAFWRLCGRIKV
ncbi:Mitochondrial inner membrane translocase complex, subunit Tim44-related protein [Thalictrum thalictroides]|uniref:Large ribosomal subunit protein mL45 n=1 Tax=Thalictrum thalictroides TaxID=46969 RepID=A0A7J6WKL1_THATH|nr:Mitochondrial inner membrane translocase complex, subunit Tim44-related protein [Thalictrum thalictroides]